MLKLTKADIENLAIEIAETLASLDLATDIRVYYNNKCIDYDSYGRRTIIKDINPHEYISWAAYDHIITMSYEGPLFDYIYERGCFPDEVEELIDNAGLYYEFGEYWNLTFAPAKDDMEIEYTVYERPVEPEHLYLRKANVLPELKNIMEEWYKLSSIIGDVGSCVIGAGFNFNYNSKPYFMGACSPYQGSISWETPKEIIRSMLEEIGATDIHYDYGRMD